MTHHFNFRDVCNNFDVLLVVLFPALKVIYPALASQFILLLLATSIVSLIAAKDLFHVAAFLESRTFRSFEIYLVVTGLYLMLALFAGAAGGSDREAARSKAAAPRSGGFATMNDGRLQPSLRVVGNTTGVLDLPSVEATVCLLVLTCMLSLQVA